MAVRCDVTRPGDVQNLFAEARARYGPVDIVIANAGGNFERRSVEDSDIDDWRRLCASTCSASITPANTP